MARRPTFINTPCRSASPYRGQNSLIPNQGRETWDVTLLRRPAALARRRAVDQSGDRPGLRAQRHARRRRIPERRSLQGRRLAFPTRGCRACSCGRPSTSAASSRRSRPTPTSSRRSQTANRLVITVGKFGVDRRLRHQQIRARSAQRLHELGAGRHRHLRLRRRRLGLHLWRGGGVVPGQLDAARRRVRSLDRAEQHASSIRASASSSGSARSSIATSCGASPARSPSPAFSPAAAWAASPTPSALAQPDRRSPPTSPPCAAIAAAPGSASTSSSSSSTDLGVFARAGVADGDVEPYEFTDIDRTRRGADCRSPASAGAAPTTPSASPASSTASRGQHQAFLNAGGLGILVGDGQLPHPGAEQIIETVLQPARAHPGG